MKKENIIPLIIIPIILFILIISISILMINQMETKFTKDCEKQNFKGIKEYWDLDIDCSDVLAIKETIKKALDNIEDLNKMEKQEI